jgi:RNA-directed DNA polymerase
MQQWTPLTGVPQESGLSPLLSNLYLHPFDHLMAQAGYTSVRYCDNFVILYRTQAEAEAVLAAVDAWMAQHGLRLHSEKTRLVEANTDDKGFDFLGYRFAKGRRYVRPKSLQALRNKIRQKTGRTRSGSLPADHGRPQPDAARLVWLLQTRVVFDISGHRRLCASSTSGDLTSTA